MATRKEIEEVLVQGTFLVLGIEDEVFQLLLQIRDVTQRDEPEKEISLGAILNGLVKVAGGDYLKRSESQ